MAARLRRAGLLALTVAALDAASKEVDAGTSVVPPAVPCSILGGLLSVDVSARCCFTTQVVTQRALEHYGMAQQCRPAWDCEDDGLTPKVSFQRNALRDMCAEPACLTRVLEAMNSSWMTARGVPQYGHVCESPALTGAKAPMHQNLARRHKSGGGARRLGRARGRAAAEDEEELADVGDDPSWEVCLRDICDQGHNNPDQFVEMCDRLQQEGHACHEHCCQTDSAEMEPTTIFDEGMCFPGEALADVEGRGAVPVGELRAGDRVLGRAAGGGFGYEPVLAFLHASRPSPTSAGAQGTPNRHAVVEVLHERGVLRASPGHLVFVDGGSRDVPVALLRPGDDTLLAADGSPSRVLAVRRRGAPPASDGLHAPLTASGTLVVDGVLASIYAWPSLQRRLPHRVAHAALLPVRLYHALQLPAVFAPLLGRLCPAPGDGAAPKAWLCRGMGLDGAAGGEELHPWLELLHGQLGLGRLLPAP